MDIKIYIVDDDSGIRRILRNIINQYNIGDIVGESEKGKQALKEIKLLQPDIVLVDLLIPDLDGITIINKINEMGLDISFIMISQVVTMEMISEAYASNIEFYIKKPINSNEVLSVLKNVTEKRTIKAILSDIDMAVLKVEEYRLHLKKSVKIDYSIKNKIESILYSLGILSDLGGKDLIEIILQLMEMRQKHRRDDFKLYQLYSLISQKYHEEDNISVSARAIERRVRRSVGKAFINIANLGIDNYESEVFHRYSNRLFDFKEVRCEINYIQGRTNYNGKLNIKKFIEGIIIEVNR